VARLLGDQAEHDEAQVAMGEEASQTVATATARTAAMTAGTAGAATMTEAAGAFAAERPARAGEALVVAILIMPGADDALDEGAAALEAGAKPGAEAALGAVGPAVRAVMTTTEAVAELVGKHHCLSFSI
jgi:hypothetical protein